MANLVENKIKVAKTKIENMVKSIENHGSVGEFFRGNSVGERAVERAVKEVNIEIGIEDIPPDIKCQIVICNLIAEIIANAGKQREHKNYRERGRLDMTALATIKELQELLIDQTLSPDNLADRITQAFSLEKTNEKHGNVEGFPPLQGYRLSEPKFFEKLCNFAAKLCEKLDLTKAVNSFKASADSVHNEAIRQHVGKKLDNIDDVQKTKRNRL